MSSHGERGGEFHDVLQRHIAFAPFDTAYIVPMKTGSLREFFLGVPALLAQRAYGFSEERLRGSFGHSLMLGR